MIFKQHIPAFPLNNYVSSIVYTEYNPTHSIERLIPDGTVNLILELNDKPQFIYDNQKLAEQKKYTHSWVSGMQSGYISISSGIQTAMMVVQFKPSAAYSILHLPVNELNDLVIDAELVFGSSVDDLRNGIIDQKDIDQKFDWASKWLINRAKSMSIPEAVIQYAVEETMLNPTSTAIKEIVDKTGYSQRHFIQLFKKHVGLTPKQYHRIIRFNQVLGKIDLGEKVDWTQLSYDCGYYDQAHFIKEFKYFSGFNPKKFMKEKGEFINYVPLV